MAITDENSARAAYIAGLNYESDISGATAQSFLGAVRYFVGLDAQSYDIAGRQLSRYDLQKQAESAEKFVRASPANGARPNMFTRGRTCGLGI